MNHRDSEQYRLEKGLIESGTYIRTQDFDGDIEDFKKLTREEKLALTDLNLMLVTRNVHYMILVDYPFDYEDVFKYQSMNSERIRYCCEPKIKSLRRKKFSYIEDVKPLSPCAAGAKRFIRAFGKEKEITWTDMVEAMHQNKLIPRDLDWLWEQFSKEGNDA